MGDQLCTNNNMKYKNPTLDSLRKDRKYPDYEKYTITENGSKKGFEFLIDFAKTGVVYREAWEDKSWWPKYNKPEPKASWFGSRRKSRSHQSVSGRLRRSGRHKGRSGYGGLRHNELAPVVTRRHSKCSRVNTG